MRNTALLASSFSVLLAACGDDLGKPETLDKPRILAVRAEPPQPSFGVTTTLSTLLYQPPPEHLAAGQCPMPGVTTYKWSWCPIEMVADSETNTFECPFPEEGFRQLYTSLGLGEAPPYELGLGETMTFPNPFPAPLSYALCRGDIGSTLGGAAGDAPPGKSVFTCVLPAKDIADKVDVTDPRNTHPISLKIAIKVEVTPACPDLVAPGFSPLIGLYKLHLPTDDSIPANQNPVLSGIFATEHVAAVLDGGLPALDGAVPLQGDPVVIVRRHKQVGLALDMDISTAEHLPVPGTIDYVAANQTQPIGLTRHYEYLTLSWYVETGELTGNGQGHDTGYLPTAIPDTQPDQGPSAEDRASFEFNTRNTWDLPRSDGWGHETARIIVVVRDGRGGVAWTSKQVSLEDKP